jgi:hypothetical protein
MDFLKIVAAILAIVLFNQNPLVADETISRDRQADDAQLADADRQSAMRTMPKLELRKGLYLEAGKAIVRKNQMVSIPIYLRHSGATPHSTGLASLNFEVSFNDTVAVTLPHPERDRNSPSLETDAPPDAVRGNLLGRSALIAGNKQTEGRVLFGFASNANVLPGRGQPGETITEVFFQAIGAPGDYTNLNLKVTMASDTHGHAVPIETINGWIKIYAAGSRIKPCKSRSKPAINALDAYRALLMSVARIETDPWLDVNRDDDVDSTDAALILRMTGQESGEVAGPTGCDEVVPFSEKPVHPEVNRNVVPADDGKHAGREFEEHLGEPITREEDPFPDLNPKNDSGREDQSEERKRTNSEEKNALKLDAYRALLMSVKRLYPMRDHDLDADGIVNSHDSSLILREMK